MANKLYEENDIQAIADAIREKSGSRSIVPTRITDDTHQYVTIYVDIAADGTLTPSGAGKNGGQFYNPEVEPAVADFSGNQVVTVYWGGSASSYRSDSKQVTLTYTVQQGGGDATYKVSEMAAAIRGISTVSVSAKTITANGTYTAPSGQAYSPVTVNVPSKAVQVSNKIARVAATSYSTTTVSLTVAKTGVYTVRWCCYRSGTSGTYGSWLYIGNSAYGTAQTTWIGGGNTQEVTLNNVSLTAGQTITVRARSNSTSTQIYVAGLVITEV